MIQIKEMTKCVERFKNWIFFFFLGLPLFVSSSSCRLLLLLVASLEVQNAEMGKGDLTNERVRWSQRVREREIVR